MIPCDRYWFLTWTMYGNWLPGDPRGFVSNVRDGFGPEVRHNQFGTEYDSNLPGLQQSARMNLIGDPIRINVEQAEALFEQFRETAIFRNWKLFAIGIMSNHCHLVVGVPGDWEPENILKSFKSYGSRRLNKSWTRPKSDTWWTESGSKRKLPTREAVLNAFRYVLNQEFPLLIWTAEIPELNLLEGKVTKASGGC